ncbi:MAG: NitT/TauT family transport system permease protein [Burkholderiaceae bacterium]|jgi:NitT/TauT family transport system permease protein
MTTSSQTRLQTRMQSAASAPRWGDGLLLVATIAVLWQLASWGVGGTVLPTPLRTLQQVGVELADEEFLGHLAETSMAFGVALCISLLGGIALGIVLGARRLAGDVFEPLLIALYSIPKISLYPIVLLMFGLGISAKIAFGAIHGIIPVVIFTMTAVRNIRPVYLRAIRTHRLTAWQGAIHVLIPATVPEIVAGLRIGFSLTLLGTLLGEMFASQRGIGHLLMRAIDRNDAPTIMALSLMLFLFATIVSLCLLQWDRRLRRAT